MVIVFCHYIGDIYEIFLSIWTSGIIYDLPVQMTWGRVIQGLEPFQSRLDYVSCGYHVECFMISLREAQYDYLAMTRCLVCVMLSQCCCVHEFINSALGLVMHHYNAATQRSPALNPHVTHVSSACTINSDHIFMYQCVTTE